MLGSDGSTKLVQRIPIPAVFALEQGRMPHHLALTIAAWICCVCPPAGFEPGAVAGAMVEPKINGMRAATAGATDVESHVRALVTECFPETLVAHDAFVSRIVELTQVIVRSGVRAATTAVLAAR